MKCLSVISDIDLKLIRLLFSCYDNNTSFRSLSVVLFECLLMSLCEYSFRIPKGCSIIYIYIYKIVEC